MEAISIIDENIKVDKFNLRDEAFLPNRFGLNGLTPFIGENGNWWIGFDDTGVKAEGYFKSSTFEINEHGYLIVKYEI